MESKGRQDEEVIGDSKEKSPWATPKIETLAVTKTLGGAGDFESDLGGQGPVPSGG